MKSKGVMVKTLQSLAGSLNFYAHAKPRGRPFIRRLYDLIGSKPGHHHINVNAGMRKDLKVWLRLLENTSVGMPFVDCVEVPGEQLNLFTDASGSGVKGSGCYFDGQWMQGKWPQGFLEEHKPSIAWMELYTLTVAMVTWAEYLTTRRVVVRCNNTAAVIMVNTQTSKCPRCMALIRLFVFTQLDHDFRLKARYIKSEENTAADALSQFQDTRFVEVAPLTDSAPSQLPAYLCPPSSSIWTSCWF